MAEQFDDDTPRQIPSLWSENHGNLLLIVMLGVSLVGAAVLFYRQNRLQKPRFPDSDAIQQVGESSDPEPLSIAEGSAVVSIVVIGAANSSGSIQTAIYDSIASFNEPDKAFRKESLSIVDGQSTLLIPRSQLPNKFAIAAYHDENGDGMLNRNRIGIPTERYGFSRNARGLTGPPLFQQAVVERSKVADLLEISIR